MASTSLGVFSGFGYADGIETMGGQVSVQLIGVVVTILFTAVVTYLILKVVSLLTGGLRITEEQEFEGLDHVEHEETGYNL